MIKNAVFHDLRRIESMTPIHHYSQKLLVGDAIEIVSKMKKNINTEKENNPFQDGDWDYLNDIKEIKKYKNLKFYTMPFSGGAYHQLFFSKDEFDNENGFYLDVASSEFRHESWVPKAFYSKKHYDNLLKIIKNSLDTSKPISELECPSKKVLFCQTADDVLFYNEKEVVSIDYKNRSIKDIILELEEYCITPKVKFSNFMSHEKDYTYDFFIDNKLHKKFEIYKIFFQNKTVDSFADYYATYYANEKNLYKRKYMNKERKEKMKEWQKDQLGGIIPWDDIMGKDYLDKGDVPIDRYKSYVDDNDFFMGYYFKGI